MNKITSTSHKHYSIPALEDYKQNITVKYGVFLIIDLLLVFVSGTQHDVVSSVGQLHKTNYSVICVITIVAFTVTLH